MCVSHNESVVVVRQIGLECYVSGFVCPKCSVRDEPLRICMASASPLTSPRRQTKTEIFAPTTGGAEKMCKDMNVPFLGRVPIDPRLARACDEGKNYCATYPDAPGVKALGEIVASTRTLFALHGAVVVPQCLHSTVSR